jgi:putative methyltransferase
MLWGTTLSMQSVDHRVLEAINRQHLGIDNYRRLKARYQKAGIPTYTELILGLPLETRGSFIDGIGKLFEIGIHDDIRVFELALLPNSPLSQPAARAAYGIKTRQKPLRLPTPDVATEAVELVFETATMPYADWAYCLLFAETIQALHNGGYTRFIARYLNDSRTMGYGAFYDGLLTFLLGDAANRVPCFARLRKLIADFYHDPTMPQIHRVLSQPDMMAVLAAYNPRRKGWPMWTYIWLMLSEDRSTFYRVVAAYLEQTGVAVTGPIEDLLHYQQDIMLTLDYDPMRGKTVTHRFDWHGYFFDNAPLEQTPTTLHYGDTTMGISHRYELVAGDREKFLAAAVGISYPYTKFRHFFHQPDRTKRL